jgi:undecaprenyl-diphosphatase
MIEMNKEIFLALNAGADPSAWAVLLARLMAIAPVLAAGLILAGLWVWGNRARRGPLLATITGLLTAFLLTAPFAFLWYTPRPFVLGIGHTLMAHADETSFPSDHATLVWSVAFSLITTGAGRVWGWGLVLLGFATAWARIYLGVHFPFDMAGSFIISLLSAAVARLSLVAVKHKFLSPVERRYETILRRLNLPEGLFPRSDNQSLL